MIIRNSKLRILADYFLIPFTLLIIRRIKKNGNKDAMIKHLNDWKNTDRTKSIPFKIAKWYANK